MEYELLYGRGRLSIALPPQAKVTVIKKNFTTVPEDPLAVIHKAFESPVGSLPLSELVQGSRTACIVICDITRPVPNGLFLRPMIEQLIAQGLPASGITVLIATGLHRPNEGEELQELIGDPWVLQTVKVMNHFARNDEDHVDLGVTRTRGTPIKINRRFVDADLRIVTGLVEPHFMAGYSGGRKVVAPGVAHAETIRTFHSARFMEDPYAIQCNLISNPLHEEQLEIVQLLQPIYALNTVLDDHRNLIYATFGEVIESHLEAVKIVRRDSEISTGKRFFTVVTSAAGYPLDRTYYQTVKGMVTPMDILEPGGTLIIVADCSEGLGSEEFRDAQRRLVELGPDQFLETLKAKSLADIDEWQTEMQLKPMRIGKIQLFSEGLPDADRPLTGIEMISDVSEAIRASMAHHQSMEVAIIPEGPYVVPFVEARR